MLPQCRRENNNLKDAVSVRKSVNPDSYTMHIGIQNS